MAVTPFLAITLDGSATGPALYRQLYEGIRAMILDGRLAVGVRLPASRTLASDLGVSRNTVTTAFDQLIAEGYLDSRRGAGTYVSTELPDAVPQVAAPPMPADGEDGPRLSRRGQALSAISRGAARRPRPFAAGLPALDAFPFDLWARLLSASWRQPRDGVAMSVDPGGYAPLRRAIADYLQAARGVRCSADQVIVVSGAQTAIHLVAQVLLDPGDRVLVEEPGYAGIRGALIAAGAEAVPTAVDDQGLDVAAAAAGLPARLVCVTPSHQFPLGVVMSLARRLELLDWAGRHDAWILEDDYDSEYRYAERPLAALQGLDRHGRVVYVGTFSKVMFPSLRLGYLVVPPALVDAFIGARSVLDDHASLLAQPALARFIEEGHFAAHLRRMRRLYAARQQALLAAAETYLGDLLDVRADPAGMHLIADLAPGLGARMTDREAAHRAAVHGVVTNRLSAFYAGPAARQGLLLGYAGFSDGQIANAARRLRAALVD